MSKYDTVVVNLFGGPGIGKTTTANRLVGQLKMNDIDAVYISEYIKELIYKANSDRVSSADKEVARKLLDGSLYSQSCVFARQKELLDIHVDQVPVIVTDSPLPLNVIYLKDNSEAYNKDVLRCFNDEYLNINIVLQRDPNALFQSEGRIHNKTESVVKDMEIVKFLRINRINFVSFPVNDISSMFDYMIRDDFYFIVCDANSLIPTNLICINLYFLSIYVCSQLLYSEKLLMVYYCINTICHI